MYSFSNLFLIGIHLDYKLLLLRLKLKSEMPGNLASCLAVSCDDRVEFAFEGRERIIMTGYKGERDDF